MNKINLIKQLVESYDITVRQATTIAGLFFNQMAVALANGDRVEIRGLCSFFVKDYKSYSGRNPKTREIVAVPPKKLPYLNVV